MQSLLVVFLCTLYLVKGDKPLFLSQYLNNPDVGQSLSKVKGIPYEPASYSGFFTVGQNPVKNTFFWFFQSESADPNAPVVVWLQGGPGGSSMFGLFGEHGPFSVSTNYTLIPRGPTAWTKQFSMLYIDNPVGVGFSFTDSDKGFVTNEEQVAQDLFSFLEQFFTVFYQYKSKPFWIAAESYGGKYGPSAAYYIHQQILANKTSINLKGIAIGDGALDPRIQFTDISNLVFYLAMADQQEREVIQGYERRIGNHIDNKEWKKAFEVFDELMNGDFFRDPTYFNNITGLTDYFNFLSPNYPPNPFSQYLNLPTTKAALHVGSYHFASYNSTVERFLVEDWMQPISWKIPALAENYRCLFYNGQNDVILGGPLTTEVLRRLNWKHQHEFNTAKKKIWHSPDGKDVSGYVVSAQGLTHVIVRNAGHMVPADQPERAFDMIRRFIMGLPWN